MSTVVNLVIYAAAMLMTNWLVPDAALQGEINQFLTFTNAIMTLVIFGLDQSYTRFHNEPPGRLESPGLFRLCFYLSVSALVVAGLVCSLFFAAPLRAVLHFNLIGPEVIPLVFLNAFFYMVVRYFYVLYRMELNLRLYTLTNILMNLFFKMFHLFGAFFENQMAGMVAFSLLGLGGFALFLLFSRRRLLRPRKSDVDRDALRVILPYGAAAAPTAIMTVLNLLYGQVFVANSLGGDDRGIYTQAGTLSNIVAAIQLGFAAFWGAYMYANYKTQQERIKQVHDIMNLVVLVFFAIIIAFEDIIFWVLASYKGAQPILPLMMLGAVLTVLLETTTYGSTIARKPIFDTLGNAVALGGNVLLLAVLAPRYGLVGAALALALANFGMYLLRTLAGQYYYRTIRTPAKTVLALLVAFGLAAAGTVFHAAFLPRLLCSLLAIAVYCLMYRAELLRCWQLALSILRGLAGSKK